MNFENKEIIHFVNGFIRSVDGHWVQLSKVDFIQGSLQESGSFIIFCRSGNLTFSLAEGFPCRNDAQKALDFFIENCEEI